MVRTVPKVAPELRKPKLSWEGSASVGDGTPRTEMGTVVGVDWGPLLAVDPPLAEIVLRGSLTYLVSFAFLRLFKREAGSVGIADLLVLVLIADAAQNAMADGYTSVTNGAVLVGTLLSGATPSTGSATTCRECSALCAPDRCR